MRHTSLSNEKQAVQLRIPDIKGSNLNSATGYADGILQRLKHATTPSLHNPLQFTTHDNPSFQRRYKKYWLKTLNAFKAPKTWVHNFSKNVPATSESQAPEGWNTARSVPRTHKYYVPATMH